MKKQYIIPKMTVVSMRPAAMLAQSPITNAPVDPNATPGNPAEAESREFIHDANAWDEW